MSEPTLLILTSLAGGEKHGYAMLEDIEAFARIRLGPGTLYGAITRLEQCGWIRPVASKKNDRRLPYAITGAGKQHLEDEMAAWSRVVKAGIRRLGRRASLESRSAN